MGHPVNYPDNSAGLLLRFQDAFALPADNYEVDPVVADALDKLLILHADHEQNCSTINPYGLGLVKSKHLFFHLSRY